MRVAVDATPLLNTRTGVGNFTAALIEGLVATPDIEVTAFPVSIRGRRDLRAAVPAGAAVATPPLPARLLRELWRRVDHPKVELAIGRHDVVHGPNFVVPPSRAARVATVHDLSPLHHPELVHPTTLVYPDIIRRAARAGAWIHTDSEAVRSEVVEFLGVDAQRVVAVPLGVTPMTGGDADAGRRRAGHDLYVLAVGTVEPRKDLPGLVKAIDLLAAGGREVPLIHVGPDGWGTEALDRALGEMRRPDLVTRLGRIDDAPLRDLYAGAHLVAYPSVYEGFGLPVLEAMSAGVPVVSTQVAAVEEVAADAALLVPVGDVDALASAIDQVWSDAALRSRLIDGGHRRVAGHSWDACIDGIVDLYRRALR